MTCSVPSGRDMVINTHPDGFIMGRFGTGSREKGEIGEKGWQRCWRRCGVSWDDVP